MKNENNSGVALYLVVVFVAIASSLLAIMYSNMTSTAISEVNTSNSLQEKLYLESASELLRFGYSDLDISTFILQIGGQEIEISREDEEINTDDKYSGNYIIKMENTIWELNFSLSEGVFTNYYFKESE